MTLSPPRSEERLEVGTPAGAGMGLRLLRALGRFRELMILLVIVGGAAGLSIASPEFRTTGNLLTVLLGVSAESMIAVGMTILLVAGGFDLSVGSTFAFAGAAAAWCMKQGYPVPAAVGAGLGCGALVGLINGLIIVKLGINPFVTTLAMLSILRGALLKLTEAQNISGLPESFKVIGQGELAGIQYPILIALGLIVVGDLLLRKSRFLRQNYYIGGNEKAAVLSGIPVGSLKLFNYALTGLLAGLAGVVTAARFGSASVTAGTGLELKVISAVIIGGASLSGGEGTVLGAFLGALLMALIISALNLLGVDPNLNPLVIGGTLLLAVLIDTLGKRRSGA